MRHYEIVLMMHPDQTEQVPALIAKYTQKITESGGQIHRQEDWGRRALAYPVKETHKAHYVLLNVEVSNEIIDELRTAFRYNDVVIRDLILKMDGPVTEPSPFIKNKKEERKDAA